MVHSIFGFELGGSFATAVAASGLAGEGDVREGAATVAGVPARLTLKGQGGVLIDVAATLTPDRDPGFLVSPLPGKLEATLGAPTLKQADLVQWRSSAIEVDLQRREVWAKGEDTPQVEWHLRARLLPIPEVPVRPEEADLKALEAQKAREAQGGK